MKDKRRGHRGDRKINGTAENKAIIILKAWNRIVTK